MQSLATGKIAGDTGYVAIGDALGKVHSFASRRDATGQFSLKPFHADAGNHLLCVKRSSCQLAYTIRLLFPASCRAFDWFACSLASLANGSRCHAVICSVP